MADETTQSASDWSRNQILWYLKYVKAEYFLLTNENESRKYGDAQKALEAGDPTPAKELLIRDREIWFKWGETMPITCPHKESQKKDIDGHIRQFDNWLEALG
ncbi:MAG: hypothetical protein WDN47_00530 [Candidatus Doudnabacteria bacterium]